MKLTDYKTKRDFSETPEPPPKNHQKSENFYVIQRHSATSLHFDFRLSFAGVLKSWAIPKNLPEKIDEKHLAIQTEDHPIEYATFEGEIPPGQYGAGQVEIWDCGKYFFVHHTDPAETFKITLEGDKLDGYYNFINLHNSKGEWLVTRKPWDLSSLIIKAKQKPIKPPYFPMMAKTADQPFDDPDWLFELKLDGYRIIAEKKNSEVTLYSRNQQNFTHRYEQIVQEISQLDHDIVLDGEVVALDAAGRANFQTLQELQPKNAYYYLFDCLSVDGFDLQPLRLIDRKRLLKIILPKKSNRLHYLDHIENDGEKLYALSLKQDYEGIVAKKITSAYEQNNRSANWQKIKNIKTQEFLIVGFTPPTRHDYFAALALGVWENKAIKYIGKVGTGFNYKSKNQLYQKMQPLIASKSSVQNPPKEPITWLKPELVAQIKYREITQDNFLRQPVYLGLREDVPPEDVELEKTNKNSTNNLTNLDKILWPEQKITKGEMINYYERLAPIILPYIKNRPLSLNRFPNGIHGKNFYQKNFPDVPGFIKTVSVSSGNGQPTHYILGQDKQTLKYIANLASIELNIWLSRAPKLDNPDIIVLDLDPETIDFSYVVKTANTIHQILAQSKIPSYVKTSGATGLHILIPIKPIYTYDQTKSFAHLIAKLAHAQTPDFTSLERSPSKRQHKVYIDYLQNNPGQTITAPYSLRPRPGAPVSTPLDWKELTEKINPSDFNISTIEKRLKIHGDILKPLLKNPINLKTALDNISENFL